jgi:6-phosphogluconolactonase
MFMASSNQSLLFVGSYAAATQPGLYAFRFDDATGELTECGSFAGIVNPSFLVVHPNGRWLYTVSETSEQHDGTAGRVWAFRFERAAVLDPLDIQPINYRPSGGDSPCHLQLDSAGEWLLVSNYGAGNVAVLPILPDGSLGAMTDLVQHHGSSANPHRQEGPHAHSAALAPDNHFAIVADLGMDQLLVYEFDSSAGKLIAHSHTDTRPGAGPRHIAFHPNGQRVYVANELDSTVNVYDYDPSNGALYERQTIDILPPGAPENMVADIHLAPSGQRVYVSNRGHNSLAVFDVEPDGRLTRVAIASCGGNWPRNFTLAPSDRFILVANQYSGDVSVLPVLTGSEAIGVPIARVAVAQASCVQIAQANA